MALTSRITKTLDIPNEPGESVTIRKLSHHQLMMAVDGNVDRKFEKLNKLGESAKYLPDPTKDPEAKREAEAEAEKPVNKYDRLTVLRYGITAWTYDAEIEAAAADLDEDTAAWLFEEIIAFSVRSADEGKASANGSQPSTVPAEVVGLPS